MTTRRTSIETYHAIRDQGLLSALRMEVYSALYEHGPCTQMELCRKINNHNRQDRSYMPRFAELERMGLIESIGERHCSVTGRMVMVWETTDSLPIKLDKPETSKQKIKRLEEKIKRLEQEVEIWKRRCASKFASVKFSEKDYRDIDASLSSDNSQMSLGLE